MSSHASNLLPKPSLYFSWVYKRKWAATAITLASTFISPVSSSMLAPVSDQIVQEFGINSTVIIVIVTSIFLLAYGKFFQLHLFSWLISCSLRPTPSCPSLRDLWPLRVLQLANFFFLISNLACGFSQNTTQILVFRFLSGLGRSAPLPVSLRNFET